MKKQMNQQALFHGLDASANGGGFEGADRLSRSMSSWYPNYESADSALLPEKDLLDARSADLMRNDGYFTGAADKYRDSIVGAQFHLNSDPMWRVLGFSEDWADEFQQEVEERFSLYADSSENWVDASGQNNLTSLLRLATGGSYFIHGEVLAVAEYIDDGRPWSTAIQLVDPARLSNPHGMPDSQFLRGGKRLDRNGRCYAGWIRKAHPFDVTQSFEDATWRSINASLPWGRKQLIHHVKQQRISQSRGIGLMVSALKEIRTRRKLSDVELQNVVLNSVYAASLESDLPAEIAAEILGADSGETEGGYENLVAKHQAYFSGKNVYMDGVKVPVLPPGTKLNMQRSTTNANSNFSFEKSLLRYMARPLGMSYEELTGDFTSTNFASAKAALGESWKSYNGTKAEMVDPVATDIFALFLEEEISKGRIHSLPKGFGLREFYTGNNKAALTNCSWLGAPRPEIDPEKERRADIMGLAAGTFTFEEICAKRGKDWRQVLRQRSREQKFIESLGLVVDLRLTATAIQDDDEKTSENKAVSEDE